METSYVEAVQKAYHTPKQQSNTPIHSLIISSKTETDYNDDVINQVKTAVNPNKTGIRVDQVRKVRNKKMVIGCENKEEVKHIKGDTQKNCSDTQCRGTTKQGPAHHT